VAKEITSRFVAVEPVPEEVGHELDKEIECEGEVDQVACGKKRWVIAIKKKSITKYITNYFYAE